MLSWVPGDKLPGMSCFGGGCLWAGKQHRKHQCDLIGKAVPKTVVSAMQLQMPVG